MNKTILRELAKQLNIQTVARKKYDLDEDPEMSNLEYLQFIFERELEIRRQNAVKRNRKNANLPQLTLDENILHEGIRYQLNSLKELKWVQENKNILITGKPMKNKTAIATNLANVAIDNGYKAFYITLDELLLVAENKEKLPQAKLIFSRILKSDVLVIDDFLYLDLPREELEYLYRLLISLTATTSIIFVANREPKEWIRSSSDKYTLELIINRTIATCERMLV